MDNKMEEMRDIDLLGVPDPVKLRELAVYLEGLYEGKQNIWPLGIMHLDNLWIIIKYLNDRKIIKK